MENSPDAPQQKADSDRHRQRDGSAPRCFREDGGQYRAHRQFGHDLRIPAWQPSPPSRLLDSRCDRPVAPRFAYCGAGAARNLRDEHVDAALKGRFGSVAWKGMIMSSLLARLQKVAILGASVGVVSATVEAFPGRQGAVTDIVRFSYVETSSRTGGASEELVEQGTISIAPDGRYRIDRQKGGVASAEIVDVAANKRIILDVDKRIARSGTMLMAPIVPGPGPRPVEQPGPRTSEEMDRAAVSLGTRVVDGVTLEGTRQTVTSRRASGSLVVNTAEMWGYRSPNRRLVLVELRLTSELEDGRRSVDDRQVVGVSRVPASDDLFNVPAGFSVVDSLR